MINMETLCGMVIEGGGARGYAYGGVPAALQRLSLLRKVRHVAGTSAGAVLAMQLAMGATAEEIWRSTMDTDFSLFLKKPFPVLFHFVRNWGLFSSHAAEKWLRSFVDKQTGDPDFTFGQLDDLADKTIDGRQYRHLSVVATDLASRQPVFFSARTAPTMPIWLAIRASMSLPLIWPPVRYDDHLYVDGGLTQSVPFHALPYLDDDQIFGLRVSSNQSKIYRSKPLSIETARQFATVSTGMMLDSGSTHLSPKDFARTIIIDVADAGTMEFSMARGRKLGLLVRGYQATIGYFSQKKWMRRF